MVTDYYLPTLGGVQTSIKAQKEALEEKGHRVTVLTPLHQPGSEASVVQLPTSGWIKPDGYPLAWPPRRVERAVQQHLVQLNPDVVHVHSEMFAAYAGLRAARSQNLPLVQTMHGRLDIYTREVLPAPALSTWVYEKVHAYFIPHTGSRIAADTPYTVRLAARRMWANMVAQANFADQVIVPSQHFAQKLVRQGVTKPLTVLSNGIEPSVLDALPQPSARQLCAGEPLRVMWCGRVSPEKRPLVFLEAIKQLREQGKSARQVEVSMVGEGVAAKQVRTYLKENRLEGTVNYLGGVPQHRVLQLMGTHHVFVSSSYDFDNQPMVLLETVATGLPTVCSDPDMAEVLPAGATLVTQTPSAEALSEALLKLSQEPWRISRMSAAAISAAESIEQGSFIDTLLEVYRGAIEDAKKR